MKKKGTFTAILLTLVALGFLVSAKVMAVPNHGVVIEHFTYTCPPGAEPDCVYFVNGTCWVDI